MSKKEWILVAVASLVFGLLFFLVWKRTGSTPFVSGLGSVTGSTRSSCGWPISSGNKVSCPQVKQLQTAINRFPRANAPLVVDGFWGPLTIEALEQLGKIDIANGPLTQERFHQEFEFV